MKKSYIMLVAGLLAATSAFAVDEPCYQVSQNPKSWSRTPELLCLTVLGPNRSNLPNSETLPDRDVEITLKTGLRQEIVAQFNLMLKGESRPTCFPTTRNQSRFVVGSATNSVWNALTIQFNGSINPASRDETGTVTIGANKFYYKRSL